MFGGRKQSQRGVSMVEMLIGLFLGTIITGGGISVYLASKRSYTEAEQYAELSENAYFSERIITDALRHVGFFGEVPAELVETHPSLDAVVGDCTGAAAAYDFNNYLFATTADDSGNAIGCITDAVPESEVLVVKSVMPTPLSDGPRLVADHDPDNEDHGDGAIDNLRADQTYVLTNNTVGILFDGSDTQPSIALGGMVPNGVAWAYRYEVFYIRDTATPQLARKTLEFQSGAMNVVTEDLVGGAEILRMRFGTDADGDGEVDTYTNIAGVGTAWEDVVSVEVSLLFRSTAQDPNYVDEKTYSVSGVDFTANDNFRRLLISTNISLRNPKLIIRGGAA